MKFLVVLALLALVAAAQAIDLPDLTRRWYVAGKFDRVKNKDGTYVAASNFAYFDGTSWGVTGTETSDIKGANGPVYTVSMDAKFNLLIGGAFTTVNGVATGPVARFNNKNSKWESIIGAAVFAPGSSVHSVVGNCFSKTLESLKASVTTSRCDVYFGGNFTATSGSTKYYSIARWKQTSETAGELLNLGTHPIRGTVYAVYKKPVPTITSSSSSYLWVGGNLMPTTGTDSKWFGRFENVEDEPTWVGLDAGMNGPVLTFAYDITFLITAVDKLYVGGNFSFVAADNNRCPGLCLYNHKEKAFKKLASTDVGQFDNAVINDIGLNGNDIVVGGQFTAPFKNMAYLPSGQISWSTVHGAQQNNVDFEVKTLDVCSKVSKSCTAGSVASGSKAGEIIFYNNEDGQWTNFGASKMPLNATDGNVVLNQIYSYAGASSATVTVAVLAAVAAVAAIVV